MQRIAIRADASTALGGGHVRRCLSLAQALRGCGFEAVFLARPLDAVAPALLRDGGFAVQWLHAPPEQDAAECAQLLRALAPSWVLVDHYGLDRAWHEAVRAATGCRIAVLDDLADRPLACDLLVDANDPAAARTYQPLLAGPAKVLGGPAFALLDPLYASAPRLRMREAVQSIGIFMGTTDPTAACLPALRACRDVAGFTGEVEVVCSPLAPGHAALARACAAQPRTRLRDALPDLAAFFARHDLQVGAGGGATWERCCIGAPTVACLTADNQLSTLPRLEAAGAGVWARGPDLMAAIGAAVARLLADAPARRRMHDAALALVDGRGSLRVAAVLACAAGAPLRLRAAVPEDEARLLLWANDPVARAHAFHPDPIPPDQHARWFRARLADPAACRLFIAEAVNGEALGQVRFDRLAEGWEISYALDPAFRGLGLGAALLQGGLAALGGNAGVVTGRVKADNAASARVFRKLRFSEAQAEDARGPHLVFRRTG